MKTTCSKPQDKDTITSISRSSSSSVANYSPIPAFLRFCRNILSSSSPSSSTSTTQKQQIYNPPPPPPPSTDDHQEEQRHKLGELHRVFTYFDENGDGKISASELQSCFRTIGAGELSDEDADNAIRMSDADGDGMLGFDDFSKLMETGHDEEDIDKIDQELRDAFSMYSSGSASGSATVQECVITPKSLKKMLTRLGMKPALTTTDCKAMIRKFDLNGDGLLNFDEFRVMMMR